jgi:hypothetical protein
LLVSGHGDDQVRRMVTIRHCGTPPISFHPSSAGVYRCCNPDLRANVCPNPKRPKNETFGRPPDASPVPLDEHWCDGSVGVPQSSAAEKPAILLTTVFSRSSGENSRNRTDRMPSRAIGKRAGATVYAAHRLSRKYAMFKLGSNVAPICFRARTHKCAGRPPRVRFALKATVSDSGATCRDAPQGDIPYNQSSSGSSG